MELMDVQQTAQYLKLARSTLAKMRVRGESPVFVRVGRRVLYAVQDVDQWVAARRRRSTSDPGQDESVPATAQAAMRTR